MGVGDGDDESSSLDEFDTCSDFTPSSAPYFSSHLETLDLSPSLLPRGVRWLRSAWREILLHIEEPGGSSESSGLGGDVMRSDFTPFPAPHIPYQLESPLLPPPPALLPSGCVGVAVLRSGGRGDRASGRGPGRARAALDVAERDCAGSAGPCARRLRSLVAASGLRSRVGRGSRSRCAVRDAVEVCVLCVGPVCWSGPLPVSLNSTGRPPSPVSLNSRPVRTKSGRCLWLVD